MLNCWVHILLALFHKFTEKKSFMDDWLSIYEIIIKFSIEYNEVLIN